MKTQNKMLLSLAMITILSVGVWGACLADVDMGGNNITMGAGKITTTATSFADNELTTKGHILNLTSTFAKAEDTNYDFVATNGDVTYVKTLTITAPESGDIYLNASFQYYVSHLAGDNDHQAKFGIVESDTLTDISIDGYGPAFSSFRWYSLPSDTVVSGVYRENISASRTYYMSSGGTKTFHLVAKRTSPDYTNTAQILYSSLSAIFIPR